MTSFFSSTNLARYRQLAGGEIDAADRAEAFKVPAGNSGHSNNRKRFLMSLQNRTAWLEIFND
jgi:hypothetical protein